MTSAASSGSPSGVIRLPTTPMAWTTGIPTLASSRSSSYSCSASPWLISLMAYTMPPIRTKRTTCREMPRGSETSFSLGHCANGVDHGSISRSVGSGPVANCMRTGSA